jgi:hypothetical protein
MKPVASFIVHTKGDLGWIPETLAYSDHFVKSLHAKYAIYIYIILERRGAMFGPPSFPQISKPEEHQAKVW